MLSYETKNFCIVFKKFQNLFSFIFTLFLRSFFFLKCIWHFIHPINTVSALAYYIAIVANVCNDSIYFFKSVLNYYHS